MVSKLLDDELEGGESRNDKALLGWQKQLRFANEERYGADQLPRAAWSSLSNEMNEILRNVVS